MRLFSRSTCRDYAKLHPSTRAGITYWTSRMERESFTSMNALQNAFATAKVLDRMRARFEIAKGYRLIASFQFQRQAVYVNFIGTHEEYDRIDPFDVDLY